MKITAKNNICSQLVKCAAVALDTKMLFCLGGKNEMFPGTD